MLLSGTFLAVGPSLAQDAALQEHCFRSGVCLQTNIKIATFYAQ